MKKMTILMTVLVFLAAPALTQAQWGWPPPGYSASGISARDGSRYRGLCALIRDWRAARRARKAAVYDPAPTQEPGVIISQPEEVAPRPKTLP